MLSILLIQHSLTPGIADANARSRLPQNLGGNPANETGPIPYLKITGALALRFHAPPPDPVAKPPAGATPPVQTPAELPSPVTVNHPPVIPVAQAADEPTSKPTMSSPLPPDRPAPSSPMVILPDDTRAATRAEDFLPFFQFPGATGNVIVPLSAPRAPVPGALPPSSATYQQR